MQDFFEWLRQWSKPEVAWFILGLFLIIAELASPELIIIFFGIGAILTAFVCMIFDISINTQLLLFAIFSVASLVMLRKYLKKIFTGKIRESADGLDEQSEYIGKKAMVVSKIEAGGEGKIELNGSSWTATSSETIEPGSRVKVIAHNNLTMQVEPDKP